MKKSKISFVLVLMLAVVTITSSVLAVTASIVDTSKTGSLTITALNQINGVTDNAQGIAGIEYTLYKVDEVGGTTITTVEQAENAVPSLTVTGVKTTDSKGKVTFTQLPLGRYYARVTKVPTGISQIPESFLVDIPMTNAAGNGWIYDVTVSPKVKTALGNAELTKTDGNNPIEGVVFKVQVSTDDANTWVDYIPDGEATVKTLTTGANGKLKLENYPISIKGENAKFRLVEVSVPDEKYILDNANIDYFYVQADGKTIVVHKDGSKEAAAEVGKLSVVNEKPQITKKVKGNLDVASVNATDKIPYNVTVGVPSTIGDLTTFTVKDTMPDGLTDRTDIVIKGTIANGDEIVPESAYTKTENEKVLTIAFKPEEIKKYSSIIITYNVKFDMDNVTLGKDGNINTAQLEYTNVVELDGTENSKTTTEDTAKVVTGGIKIYKVDSAKAALAGAKFKVATTEENAKNGVFVKDENGTDVEVTTGADGYAEIKGLAYNDDETAKDYWLVETQAPTYTDENGDEKAYTLLDKPVKVSVNGESHTKNVEVVNKKPINLPLTGGMGTVILIAVGAISLVVAKSIKKDEVKQ